MESKAILARWIALERGNGLETVRRAARYLSLAALALFILVGVGSMLLGLRSLFVVVPSLVAGWIVAERNALESRAKQWQTIRLYIDWAKVNQDHPAQPDNPISN